MTELGHGVLDRAQARVGAWVESPRAQRGLRRAIGLLAGFLLLLFLYAAARRLRYPFEVEWIESGMLVSVLRVLHGEGIYVAPTLHYVPFLYAPVYFYVAALATKIVGVAGHGYAGLRLVSSLATLGSCAAIYALVRSAKQERIAAIAAAGMYAGCYAIAGGFFDVGRVDSLFVLLVLLALLAQQRGLLILAAVLWVIAFQTKQTVLPLGAIVLCAEYSRPRRMLAALGTYAMLAACSVALLNHATGGWYGYYLFDVARGLPMVWRQVALYLPAQVIAPLAIAWAVIVAAVVMTRPRWSSDAGRFGLFVSVAFIGGVWFVEGHAGASANAMMPVFAWTAVLFGWSLGRLLELARERGSAREAVLVLAAATMQLMALIDNPGKFVPPAGAREASEEFVAQVRGLPGDVFLANHSYDAILAGKEPHAEGEALGAVLDGPRGPRSEAVRAEFALALAQRPYTAVVVDNVEPHTAAWGWDRSYPMEISTGLSGYRWMTSQAQWFLLPCDAPGREMAGLVAPRTTVLRGYCGQ